MAETNVKVVVRVRPFNRREIELGSQTIIRMNAASTVITNPLPEEERKGKQKDHTFTFDKSYWSFSKEDPHFASNQNIFDDIGKEILENAWDGFNCSVFAYGQTGSGKSYSMMGLPGDDGLIPRICEAMFNRITELSTENSVFRVQVSYMEIYNEKIRDLLDPRKKDPLKIRTHPVQGPYVESLSKFAVKSFENIVRLMELGNKSRTVASTNMNDVSSRSHAIFTLIFAQSIKDSETGVTQSKTSNINLVDLAGSERVEKTGAEGDRLKEGASINVSLSALGRVISALAESKKLAHIPYRDSVLTWLLCQALGGNAKTFMIAAISPSADNFDESLSTLRYADRAKLIVNRAVVNEDPQAKLVRELREEIERLRILFRNHGLNPEGAGGFAPANANMDEEMKLRELQIQEEAERKVSELAHQLSQTEQILADLNESWEEKVRQSETLLQERTSQLQGTGISFPRSTSSIRLDQGLPSLVNLNEDALMTECLIYYLNPGKNSVGQSDAEGNHIILSGLGVKAHHCDIFNTEGKVVIRPIGNAALFVNGAQVPEEKELQQGDRVIVGNNHIFRFNNPQADDTGRRRQVAVDWDFAQREFAQVQGNFRGIMMETDSSTAPPNLQAELLKAFHLTNEANAISQALNRQVVFNLELASQFPKEASTGDPRDVKKEIVVRVTSLENYQSCVWNVAKFSDRLFAMRDLWVQSMDQTEEERRSLTLTGEENPFLLDHEKTALPYGISHLSLTFFKYRAQSLKPLAIFNARGEAVGKLYVEVFPSDSSGKPSDGGSLVLQPSSLLGSKTYYCIRLKAIKDAPESLPKMKLFCQFSVWNESKPSETKPVEGKGSWDFGFERVVECDMTEDFFAYCSKAVLAFEIYEEKTYDQEDDDAPDRRSPKGTFDFNVNADVCELDYEGNWAPVPVKSEVQGNDTYGKLYRLRHGMQRRLVLTVTPNHGVSFKDAKDDAGALVPQSCVSLKIGKLRINQRPEDGASVSTTTDDVVQNDVVQNDVVDCALAAQEASPTSLVISCDFPATAFASDLLRKRTPPGSRVLLRLEVDLQFSSKGFTVKFEKDLTLKVHSRDAEFSNRQGKLTDRPEVSSTIHDAAMKKLAWKFRVSVASTSPKKFVVGDKGKQAEVVLRAFDANVQTLDNSLSLAKHEQDYELFHALSSGGKQLDSKQESAEADIRAKIQQLREERARIQQEPAGSAVHVPVPLPVVSEVPKKRSNTLTNYASAPTVTITHDALLDQILQLEEKIDTLQAQHLKTKERLFLSILLSIKMTLTSKGDIVSATTPASDLFEELVKTEIPEEFWPQWVQHRLLDESGNSSSQHKSRTNSVSTTASTETSPRRPWSIFDVFRS